MTDPNPRSLIIYLASARRGGNAEALARRATEGLAVPCQWVDLAALSLPAFHDPRPLPTPRPTGALAALAAQMQGVSDLVFAVPIYWYALPGPAKTFLDHWSGYLDTPGLNFADWIKTKRLWLITARADPDPMVAAPIEMAMQRTAHWLGMRWGGALHGVGDAPGDIRACETWERAPDFLL